MIAKERFEDPESGAAYEAAGSDRLVVLFGSRLGGIVAGQTPWAFVRSSAGVDVSRLFLRDHLQAWYTEGVRGFGSIGALLQLIELLAAGHRSTVLFGASMGGYGALLYGRLLGLDAIVVNPQTIIDPDVLEALGDDRWTRDLRGVNRSLYSDLRAIPYRWGTSRVIYAADQAIDVMHAESFAVAKGVELDPRPSAAHDLARELAKSGELQELIRTGAVKP